MKTLVRILILPSLFFLNSTALAASTKKMTKKTIAHQCAVYSKNAKKAKALYSVNKKQVTLLETQLKVLAEDQKRMPADVKMANKIVNDQMHALQAAKKKNLTASLLYLEKHIQYSKAAQRTCAQKMVKPKKLKLKGQDINNMLSVASL